MAAIRRILGLVLFTGSLLYAQLPFEASVSAIVTDPGSPNTLYAGTRAGVLKSTDAGATWVQAPVNPLGQEQPAVEALAIDPTRPGVVILGTNAANDYLWRTLDGGASWQSISAGFGDPESYACTRIFVRPAFGALYAELRVGPENTRATYQVWKSTDDGGSWQFLFTTDERVDISSLTPSVMYRPGRGFIVERSDDEGKTWKTAGIVRPGDSRLDGVNSVAVSPVDHDVVISTLTGSFFELNGIFRSADGGGSWTRVVKSNNIGVQFDPSNKSQVFAGDCCGGLRIYRSDDSGRTFEEIKVREFTGGPSATSLSIVANGSSFIVPTAGGPYTGKAAGPAWTVLGSYRPTLSTTPRMIEASLLARGSSLVRATLKVAALEDPRVKFSQLTLGAASADWLSVRTPEPEATFIYSTLDAANLPPGAHETSILVSSTEAVNELEVPVNLTVVDSVQKPFVILDRPVPGRVRSFALDPQGNTVFADRTQIFRLASDGSTTVIAGTGDSGYSGDGGPALKAELAGPADLAFDSSGNLHFSDDYGDFIRKIDTTGTISTVAGTNDNFDRPEAGAIATEVRLFPLGGLAVDTDGVLHFSARDHIWKVLPDGTLALVAGGGNSTTDNVRAVVASLRGVTNIMFNSDGELVFSEEGMDRVRIISQVGLVRTLAGSGEEGYSGDGGSPRNARLSEPGALGVDGLGQLYFIDQDGTVIRRLSSNGTIETVMGNGSSGDTGFCTAATTAPAAFLDTLLFTPEGWLLVADGSDSYRLWIGDQAGGDSPAVDQGAVVNAASFIPQLSEGGLFSVFGQRVAARRSQAPGKWPYLLGDAVVCLDDQPQPLYFTDTGQINGQTSYGVTPGTYWMRVYSLTGSSSALEVDVAAASPGVFQYGGGHAVATNPDLSVNGPTNPVDGGSFIVAYLTGIGAVDNPVPTGAPAAADPLSRPVGEVKVTINGQETTIIFLGLSPGFIGLAQANINIPGLPPGDYDLVITIDGVASAPVRVSVR